MAKPNPSFQKRQRERKKQERRQEKERRRAERIAENQRRREALDGTDVTDLHEIQGGLMDEDESRDEGEDSGEERGRT